MALMIIRPVRTRRVLVTTLRATAVTMSPMRIAKKIGPMIWTAEKTAELTVMTGTIPPVEAWGRRYGPATDDQPADPLHTRPRTREGSRFSERGALQPGGPDRIVSDHLKARGVRVDPARHRQQEVGGATANSGVALAVTVLPCDAGLLEKRAAS